MKKKPFQCPECGSNESSQFMCIDGPYDEDDIWSGVLQCYKCAKCGRIIPAHLAERRDGLTAEQASQEWHKGYRPAHQPAPEQPLCTEIRRAATHCGDFVTAFRVGGLSGSTRRILGIGAFKEDSLLEEVKVVPSQ